MKTAQVIGIYNPLQKLAVGNLEKPEFPFQSTARSTGATVIFLTVVPSVDRPVDGAQPVGRPPGLPAPPEIWVVTVGRPPGRQALYAGHVHISCAHRSTGPVDRQQVWQIFQD